MRAPSLLPSAMLTCSFWLLAPVNSIHPECQIHLEIQEEEAKCAELLMAQPETHKACSGAWDNLTCWRPADIGETVTVPCPMVFKVFSSLHSKPDHILSSGEGHLHPGLQRLFGFPYNRKHNFLPLQAAALHPELHPPQPVPFLHPEGRLSAGQGWRTVLWLWHPALPQPAGLLGGLQAEPGVLPILHHGQLLLAAGGGAVSAHPPGGQLLLRPPIPGLSPDWVGCWDTNEHSGPWWVIRTPILISILANFILFVSILWILLQKLRSPDARVSEQPQYKCRTS